MSQLIFVFWTTDRSVGRKIKGLVKRKVQQHFIRPATSMRRRIKRLTTAVPCRSLSGRHSRRLSDDVVRDVMWRKSAGDQRRKQVP